MGKKCGLSRPPPPSSSSLLLLLLRKEEGLLLLLLFFSSSFFIKTSLRFEQRLIKVRVEGNFDILDWININLRRGKGEGGGGRVICLFEVKLE